MPPMKLGTASWIDPTLVESRYPFEAGTIWLGRGISDVPIGYSNDQHVVLMSRTRGGKATSGITPTLLTWPGSICVVDPKGEHATVTASRRREGSEYCEGVGQTVHVLDPFRAATVEESLRSRFNPLDILDPNSEETIDEAARIADALVIVRETANDPFWDDSARQMVKTLILHVVTDPHFEGRRNLVTLRELIVRGEWEAVEELRSAGVEDIPSARGLLWAQVADNPHFGGVIAGGGDTFLGMLQKSPKVFESVLQVAMRNTEFVDSPAMKRTLEASDFKLSDLKTSPRGVSLYLSLPQRYMSTHHRWLRMMISLVVTQMEMTRRPPVPKDAAALMKASGFSIKPPAPVLVVLDEFAGLERMKVIETSVAQIAGFGVKLFFVLQSLEQLKSVYKDTWETFLANSAKIFFNVEDHFSREYISKLIGETEIIRETGSRNSGVGGNESRTSGNSTSDASSESTTDGETRSYTTGHTEGTTSSTGKTRSEGHNRSTGRTDSYGKNSSTSDSHSTGTNSSWGSSRSFSTNTTYEEDGLFGLFGLRVAGTSETVSMGTSVSNGSSEGRSNSVTKGSSSGQSFSETKGTSDSESVSTNDGVSDSLSASNTNGTSTTRGQSRTQTRSLNDSRTTGTSYTASTGMQETLQRRPLIHPDEVGRLFASIDDRRVGAYPGLALILMAGQQPMVVRRTNYFEDIRFVGMFDPHPDHPGLLTLKERAEAEIRRELARIQEAKRQQERDLAAAVFCAEYGIELAGDPPRIVPRPQIKSGLFLGKGFKFKIEPFRLEEEFKILQESARERRERRALDLTLRRLYPDVEKNKVRIDPRPGKFRK